MKNISKDQILRGIKTCAELRNSWNNGAFPNYTFSKNVKAIEDLLSELLEVVILEENK